MSPRTPLEEIAPLMEFIVEKLELVKTSADAAKFSAHGLAAQFIEETGASEPQMTLVSRIRSCRIHEMNQFDELTRAKVAAVCLVPVKDEKFLNKLRSDAIVEVDEKGKIKKFMANDGSLVLNGDEILKGRKSLARRMNGSNQASRSSSATIGNGGVVQSAISTNRQIPSSSARRAVETGSEDENSEEEPTVEVARNGYNGDVDLGGDDSFSRMLADYHPFRPNDSDNDASNNSGVRGDTQPRAATDLGLLMMFLRGAVKPLGSASLKKIEEELKGKMNLVDEELPYESLRTVLDACLLCVLKHAVENFSQLEESTSLRDFLLRFQAVTVQFEHRSMASFHQKLEKEIHELSDHGDKRITIRSIALAIDIVLKTLNA